MSWDELVAAALIGTDRRAVVASVPEGSPRELEEALAERGPEDRLLGSAAAWTVARRAGAMAGPAGSEAGLAAADDHRAIAPSTRLRMLLEGDHPSLLPEWLSLAAERGLRPPPELVPDLLDHAAGDASLHAAVGAAAGPLGHWLAERAPRWGFVRGAGGDVDGVWAGGGQAERRALFERLRRSDPVAARELLEGTFAEETWEDRAVFIAALGDGLSDADEPFLETALDDTRKIVRAAAATLLHRLPTSRLAARMAARTAPLLRVDGRRLIVELPGEPDAAALRDGVPASGRRSERLAALLAATPLSTWTGAPSPVATSSPASPVASSSPAAAASPAASSSPAAVASSSPAAAASPAAPSPLVAATAPAAPADLVALLVADDLAGIVHDGWADAAIAQRDAAWARALWPVHPDSRLLTVLPKDEAEALAAAADAPDDAARALPAPWGPKLSKAVIDAVHNRRAAGERGQDVEFAGHRLDPAFAAEADERLRPLGGRDLHRLCDVLDARAAMLRELS